MVVKPERKFIFGDLRTIMKWIFEKCGVRSRIDYSCSRYGLVIY
jgi:hypothetical protein